MTEEYRSEVLDLRGRNFAQVDNSVLKDGKILDKSSQKNRLRYVMYARRQYVERLLAVR